MSTTTKEQIDVPSAPKQRLTSYKANLKMYDTLKEDKYGMYNFHKELHRTSAVISLSPDTRWQDIRPLVWDMICEEFRYLQNEQPEDHNVNMRLNYTVARYRKLANKRADDASFFGLLARKDLSDISVNINFSHRYKKLSKHYKQLMQTKSQGKTQTLTGGSPKQVDELKPKSAQSTKDSDSLDSTEELKQDPEQERKKEQRHSCIVQ